MLLNKIRNKKLVKEITDNSFNKDHEGNLIEKKIVKAKDENMYIIFHIQFSNEDETLSYRGRYEIQNIKHHKIGYLKYILFENNEPVYMNLSDVHFDKKYRNIGLGSKVIDLFERRAKSYGAHYVTGALSSVDSKTSDDEKLRNSFYLKRGYTIDLDKIFKEL